MNPFTLYPMRLPFPTDWQAVFARPAPLIVEVGFGNGKFITALAAQQPESNLVGFEIAINPVQWTEKLVERHHLTNVRLVNGDAFMGLTCLFEPESVQTFHVNFPDPWFKKRHLERRLLDREFLQLLVSRLQVGGHLFIATDILDYANQINTALKATPGLENAYATDWLNERENPLVVTHYERKARNVGRTCYYFKWRRTAEPVIHPPVVTLDETMPNAILHIPTDLETLAQELEQGVVRYADRIVNFRGVFRHTDQPTLLIETHIEEPLFSQRLMILIQQRAPHEYLLRMAEVGYPRPTDGVHDAIYALMQQFLKRYPGSQIVEHKVKFPE